MISPSTVSVHLHRKCNMEVSVDLSLEHGGRSRLLNVVMMDSRTQHNSRVPNGLYASGSVFGL